MRERLDFLTAAHAKEIGNLREAIRRLEDRFDAPFAEEAPPPAVAPAEVPRHAHPRIEVHAEVPKEGQPQSIPVPTPLPDKTTAEGRMPDAVAEPKGSFELRFGRIWLVRLGIGLLVTGLVLLGNYAYQNWIRDLPAGVRLAALYLGSGLIFGTGTQLAKRENLLRFGEVLVAGGLAFFYWCTFAAHHVPRLKVVDSPVLAGVLLLAAAVGIAGISLRRDSRATAVMGILLASYATVLQPLGWLSALSNVLLAGAGTALMLRPGWATPGIASMAGTYVAFLWWQLAGGSGSRPEDPAALWYLPPVWAIFALPGVLGISRRFDSLTDRGKAWFAGANNAAFFLLFSLVWLMQRGDAHYWRIPAVFGAVLLGLGIAGRSRNTAGGVHVAQGLGALSLAMALKLEGYHLPLGFAMEALALSLAFRRFGGRSELGFAVLATAGAMYLSLIPSGLNADVPLWSRSLVALLPMAAAVPLRGGGVKSGLADLALTASSFVLVGGGILAWVVCCHHLGVDERAPACAVVALAFSGLVLRFNPGRRWFEWGWLALVFAVSVVPMLHPPEHVPPTWSPGIAAGLLLAAHALWTRLGPDDDPSGVHPPLKFLVWATAVVAGVALIAMIDAFRWEASGSLACHVGAALALAFLGWRLLPSPPLLVVASLILLRAAGHQAIIPGASNLLHFLPAAAAFGLLAMAGPRSLAGILARVAAVISWLIAWHRIAPESAADIVAASALGLGAWTAWKRSRALPESWVFLGWSAFQLLMLLTGRPWEPLEPSPAAHGWAVVAAAMACGILLRPADVNQQALRQGILYTACALLAAWSSQVLVWHFDWKPVAILWTMLGFGLVSGGLWGKIAALRHAGFALLAMALVKLFCVDVWDFAAFTRVAAFIALGVALVVLGFFYNRFAEVLKKLFEGDAAES